jgi:hypothetical protein
MLDTSERFHMYEISKQSLELNNNYMEIHNPIYNTIISTYQNMQNNNRANLSHHSHHTPSPFHHKPQQHNINRN